MENSSYLTHEKMIMVTEERRNNDEVFVSTAAAWNEYTPFAPRNGEGILATRERAVRNDIPMTAS